MNRTSVIKPFVINTALAAVLLGLCVWLVLFAFVGSSAAPGQTPAEERAQEFSDIRRAARAETLAFLTIDHTRMDELTDRVLAGATGSFKKEFKERLEFLKDTAASQEAFAEAHVAEVGLSEVDADSATAFVAASAKVRNKGTKDKVVNEPYPVRLTLVKEGNRWLVSQLEVVG